MMASRTSATETRADDAEEAVDDAPQACPPRRDLPRLMSRRSMTIKLNSNDSSALAAELRRMEAEEQRRGSGGAD